MLAEFILFGLGIAIGVSSAFLIGVHWIKATPGRIKAGILGIVDALAKHHEGDNFEVYGTLVIGEKNCLAVRIFVKPEEMADAIATYALKDVDITRIRRKPNEHPTSQKDPSCQPKKV